MKRINNLFNEICTIENINLADENARKKKKNRIAIIKHDLKKKEHNEFILKSLKEGTYKTSNYTVFKIYEPKERIIYRLPYYPDRIIHHAIMNILEPI